jgi:hypothetical protein
LYSADGGVSDCRFSIAQFFADFYFLLRIFLACGKGCDILRAR